MAFLSHLTTGSLARLRRQSDRTDAGGTPLPEAGESFRDAVAPEGETRELVCGATELDPAAGDDLIDPTALRAFRVRFDGRASLDTHDVVDLTLMDGTVFEDRVDGLRVAAPPRFKHGMTVAVLTQTPTRVSGWED